MSGWHLFKSREELDEYLNDKDASLLEESNELTFPCFGFAFRYADESAGLELLTKEDLARMLARIEGAK